MDTAGTIANIISTAIQLYMLTIWIRIFMSWVPGAANNQFGRVIYNVTEPFLKIFRGIRLPGLQLLDLSPIWATITLQTIAYVVNYLVIFQFITFGIVLALIVTQILQVLQFFILILGIAALLRMLSLILSWSFGYQIWELLDRLLSPMALRVSRIVSPRAAITYRAGLGWTIAFATILWLAINFGTPFLETLIASIPF